MRFRGVLWAGAAKAAPGRWGGDAGSRASRGTAPPRILAHAPGVTRPLAPWGAQRWQATSSPSFRASGLHPGQAGCDPSGVSHTRDTESPGGLTGQRPLVGEAGRAWWVRAGLSWGAGSPAHGSAGAPAAPPPPQGIWAPALASSPPQAPRKPLGGRVRSAPQEHGALAGELWACMLASSRGSVQTPTCFPPRTGGFPVRGAGRVGTPRPLCVSLGGAVGMPQEI